MKQNRIILIIVLLIITVGCIGYMNMNYDILARNTYVTKENHDLLIEKLDSDQIRYIVENNIDVTEFDEFLEVQTFDFANYKLYCKVRDIRKASPYTIVSFVNAVCDKIDEDDLLTALQYYDYTLLRELITQHSYYNANAEIVLNPDDYTLRLGLSNTIGRYEPTDLVTLSGYDEINVLNDGLRLRKEAADNLNDMCSYLADIYNMQCGGFGVSEAYMSYDDIQSEYTSLLSQYGPQIAYENYGYPSHNEHQLGLAIDIVLTDGEYMEFSEQYAVLRNIAHNYGFIFYTNENVSFSHLKRAEHIRYIGKEAALEYYQEGNY